MFSYIYIFLNIKTKCFYLLIIIVNYYLSIFFRQYRYVFSVILFINKFHQSINQFLGYKNRLKNYIVKI